MDGSSWNEVRYMVITNSNEERVTKIDTYLQV